MFLVEFVRYLWNSKFEIRIVARLLVAYILAPHSNKRKQNKLSANKDTNWDVQTVKILPRPQNEMTRRIQIYSDYECFAIDQTFCPTVNNIKRFAGLKAHILIHGSQITKNTVKQWTTSNHCQVFSRKNKISRKVFVCGHIRQTGVNIKITLSQAT